MNDKQDEPLDESPTDELPVLTELDVVELDVGSVLASPDDTLFLAGDADDEPAAATGRFPRPDELPDVEPLPEADEETAFVRRQVLLLEAGADDKEAEIASLAERLRATREAVARRDETERALRMELADAETQRQQLEARLAEADALAARYADRVAELTSRLRTLEQSIGQRDRVFAELEAELIAREARVVERERALARTENGAAEPTAAEAGAETQGADDVAPPEQPPPAPGLEAALAASREEAAALAAYIDCRRAHWLALEAQLEEHRARVRELEQEVAQRAERERREAERADAEARRADALKAELARRQARSERAAATPPETGSEESATATLRIARPDDRAAAPEAPAPPEAALVCLTSDPPREYRIGASALLVGRGSHCDVRITTHFVSREHARIVRDGGQVLIEDLGSKNGVFVNAVRVEQRGALRHGDLVTIGETQFRFETEAPAQASAAKGAG